MTYADTFAGIVCALGGGSLEAMWLWKRPQGSPLSVRRLIAAQIVFWVICSLAGIGFTAITGWAWIRVADNVVFSAVIAVVFGIAGFGLCMANRSGWLGNLAKRAFCSSNPATE